MLSKDLNLDPNVINECYEELEERIPDKKAYMQMLMAERLNKVNEITVSDFNKCLDEIVDRASRKDTTVKQMNRLMKRLDKVTTRLHRAEFVLFRVLNKE